MNRCFCYAALLNQLKFQSLDKRHCFAFISTSTYITYIIDLQCYTGVYSGRGKTCPPVRHHGWLILFKVKYKLIYSWRVNDAAKVSISWSQFFLASLVVLQVTDTSAWLIKIYHCHWPQRPVNSAINRRYLFIQSFLNELFPHHSCQQPLNHCHISPSNLPESCFNKESRSFV